MRSPPTQLYYALTSIESHARRCRQNTPHAQQVNDAPVAYSRHTAVRMLSRGFHSESVMQ